MPYRWTETPEARVVTLWPHRSLTSGGFALFIAVTAAMFAMPLLAVLGSPVLWGLLPFFGLAVAAVWWALRRSDRDRASTETLSLGSGRIALIRQDDTRPDRRWDADPYWVTVTLHRGDRPVPSYLTLRGNGREVELGAFLTPEERVALHGDLTGVLHRIRAAR